MGEVYRAVDETTETMVAVKSTDLGRWGPNQREVLQAQFRREAQTLLRLDHPLLPKFLDYFEEDQQALLSGSALRSDTLSSENRDSRAIASGASRLRIRFGICPPREVSPGTANLVASGISKRQSTRSW